jgi:hypothetical protein
MDSEVARGQLPPVRGLIRGRSPIESVKVICGPILLFFRTACSQPALLSSVIWFEIRPHYRHHPNMGTGTESKLLKDALPSEHISKISGEE